MNNHQSHHAQHPGPQISSQLIPWRRPTSSDASCWNAVGVRSTLPGAHPGHVSATVTVTDLPFAAVTFIFRPHMGLLSCASACQRISKKQKGGGGGPGTYALGLAVAPGKDLMVAMSTATMKSASVLKWPHEPRPGA